MMSAPMSMAEFDQCCGQMHSPCVTVGIDGGGLDDLFALAMVSRGVCENCPVLIEHRRAEVLRAARAL